MSKQRRLAHLFGSSKGPHSRASDAEEVEEEETEGAAGDGEDEEDTGAPAAGEEDSGDGGGDGDEEEGEDEESSATALAAISVMSSAEAKGREKLATSLARDVARGSITQKRAIALLKSAPRTGGLAKAMEGRDRNPGQEASGSSASGPRLATHDQSLVAAAEQRAKQRAARRR
ncbi:hypothetical protein [Stappia sp. ICDLI1TA098]